MSENDSDAVDQSLDTLLEEAEGALANVEERLGGVERLDELDDDTLETVLGDVGTLASVATETEELIDVIDFGDLPEAIDAEAVFEAIEIGEIPEVLMDEDAGAGDLVNFTQLFRAIDLLNAWDAAELGDLWQEKRELEGAIDDLGDGDDAGMVEGAVSDIADGDDDEEFIETDFGAEETKEVLGDIDVMEDPEAYQVAIQQQAMKGIDAFRTGLLETHEKFERLVEYNRERMRRQDTSTNSRNPTASSTMPTERAAVGSGVKHSTVPQDVHLSTAPSRKRIYGQRFAQEREKQRRNDDKQRRNDDKETTADDSTTTGDEPGSDDQSADAGQKQQRR